MYIYIKFYNYNYNYKLYSNDLTTNQRYPKICLEHAANERPAKLRRQCSNEQSLQVRVAAAPSVPAVLSSKAQPISHHCLPVDGSSNLSGRPATEIKSWLLSRPFTSSDRSVYLNSFASSHTMVKMPKL